MTRLAMVADCHVANHKRWGGVMDGGLNERGRECVTTIYRAAQAAKERSAEALFILGDLFDHTRPSPPLVAATTRALLSGPGEVVVLLGNHDRQSMHVDDHACASMAQAGVKVIVAPKVFRYVSSEVGVIPYVAGEAKDWLAAGMAQLQPSWSPGSSKQRIVVTHLGIWDDDTPPYMKAAKDAVGIGYVRWLCDAHNVEVFMAGNWHDGRSWKSDKDRRWPLVAVPGTLIPASFSDPQEHGQVVVVHDSSEGTGASWVGQRIASPLWLRVSSMAELSKVGTAEPSGLDAVIGNHFAAREPCRLYLRATVRQDDLGGAMEAKERLVALYKDKIVVHVQVREDEAQLGVKEAARAALSSGRDDLAETYADLAKVEEPGTKEGVARRLSEYRKAAG